MIRKPPSLHQTDTVGEFGDCGESPLPAPVRAGRGSFRPAVGRPIRQQYPNRGNSSFSLLLLRQGIETNPESLQLIIGEVLGLPKHRQDELAELLKTTTLSSMIAASKLVADRLNFLRSLECILFDPQSKQEVLERRGIHRILVDHLWLFGEEFHLSVDDESLTEVLRKHLTLLGRTELAAEVRAPVRRLDDTDGIVDLMLSKRIPHPSPRELEHLVIELKRPSQRVDREVVGQTEDYALAVANDERFRNLDTRWTFWAISNEIAPAVEAQRSQPNRPFGVVLELEEPRIRVWAETWAEIIHDAKASMNFFQGQLNYTAQREPSLQALRQTHGRYFPTSLLEETGGPLAEPSHAAPQPRRSRQTARQRVKNNP